MAKLKNLVFRDDGMITIKNVRASHLHCFKKHDKDGDPDKAKYKATAIIPKDTHADEIEALKEHFKGLQKEWFKKRLPAAMLCLRDGDETGKPEYENAYILVSSDRENRPLTVDKNGTTPLTAEDDKLYSGCFINLMVSPWKQDNRHGQRINANFIGVQYMAEGEKFSGVSRPKADEAFDNEGDGEDDDGFDD